MRSEAAGAESGGQGRTVTPSTVGWMCEGLSRERVGVSTRALPHPVPCVDAHRLSVHTRALAWSPLALQPRLSVLGVEGRCPGSPQLAARRHLWQGPRARHTPACPACDSPPPPRSVLGEYIQSMETFYHFVFTEN